MDAAFIFSLMLSALLLIAMVTDATRYTIPNWINGLIVILYVLMFAAVPAAASVSWLEGLYGFASVFAVGYVIFLFNIMGGGDIKLLSVLALWTGFSMTLGSFILFCAIIGGFLTLILIFLRIIAPFVVNYLPSKPHLPRVLSFGEPLPYGLAIATSFLMLLWTDQIPGLAGVKAQALIWLSF
ncbi:MAG: prepilin peptidase [Rickettsiales bacterium]|nr:prepilin peptidase [Rickettsiales bacterium]